MGVAPWVLLRMRDIRSALARPAETCGARSLDPRPVADDWSHPVFRDVSGRRLFSVGVVAIAVAVIACGSKVESSPDAEAAVSCRPFRPSRSALDLPPLVRSTWTMQNGSETVWPVGVGDVDSDGHEDVVMVARRMDDFSRRVVVLRGDGAGHLGTSDSIPIGTWTTSAFPVLPNRIAVVDAKHDGVPDIVLAGESGLRIVAGDGQGGWKQPVEVPLAGVSWPLTADVDRDGSVDLVAVTRDQHDETHSEITLIGPTGASVVSRVDGLLADAAILDWDGDGLVDVAGVTDDDSYGVVLHSGDGTGRFSETARGPTILEIRSDSNYPWITTSDIDGDQRPDLVFGDWAGVLGTFRNTATRQLERCDTEVSGSGALNVSSGDVDADGVDDLLLFDRSTRVWSLLRSAGSGFGSHWASALQEDTQADAVLLADLNGDRRADIVSIHNLGFVDVWLE